MPQTKKTWSQLVSQPQDPGTEIPVTQDPDTGPSTSRGDEVNNPGEKSISLNEIMSEQLALDLTVGDGRVANQPIPDPTANPYDSDDDNDDDPCCNDEMLAKILQHELDLEHDRMVKREEKQYNANSKVMLSFENRRRIKSEDLSDSDLEDEVHHEYGEESKHWDFFEEKEKTAPKIGKQGYVVAKNGQVTTKHDIELNNCRNACKVMEFDSDIKTGDGGGFPMKISNSVYNALKIHSISEGKRMARLHEKKEKSSAEKAVDEKSRILLFKLINRGILDTLNGIIATGKESVIIHGTGQNLEKGIPPCEVAVKVFKTTITEFQNRIQYVVGDPILEQTGKLSKQNPKLTIPLWAEKEMHNLNRMRKCGVNCPEVVLLKKHILVMTFIGREGQPAPTLKNVPFSEELFNRIWKETVKLMVKLYQECDMVHADFSEYNLLWHGNRLWCIDVSQAVRRTHVMGFRFLWRDCVNICKFFSRKLCDYKSPCELFETITGKSLSDLEENESLMMEIFDKMENYEKNSKRSDRRGGEDKYEQDFFEELFEKAQIQRKNEQNAAAAGIKS